MESLTQGHLDVKKISLQRLYQLKKFVLESIIANLLTGFLHLGTLRVDLSENVLLLFLIDFNLGDRLDLSATFCLLHLSLTESDFGFLILLLAFD